MGQRGRLVLSLEDEPFFRDMTPSVRQRIEAFVYHREYDRRQIVYFPDDPCDYVYWVREGRVKVTRVSDDSRELAFRHVLPGDMLGEECLGRQAKRLDYAEAMGPAILCLMRADDFQRLGREEVELAYRVAECLSQRVRMAEQTLANTVFKTVRSRAASGLLRLYQQEREYDESAAVIRVTHQELANLIGSTRETTTAMLHGLEREEVVRLGNRSMTVLDAAALEQIARTG